MIPIFIESRYLEIPQKRAQVFGNQVLGSFLQLHDKTDVALEIDAWKPSNDSSSQTEQNQHKM